MLPEHLHPKTYWEERAELAEEAMVEFLRVLAVHMSPTCVAGLRSVMDQWDDNITKINERYPARLLSLDGDGVPGSPEPERECANCHGFGTGGALCDCPDAEPPTSGVEGSKP